MIVEWNDRALASVERQPETSQSARGDTRTKLTPRSWVMTVYWAITVRCAHAQISLSIDLSCTERLKVIAKDRPRQGLSGYSAAQHACRAPHRSGLSAVVNRYDWLGKAFMATILAHTSHRLTHLICFPLSVIWYGSELTRPCPSICLSFLSR